MAKINTNVTFKSFSASSRKMITTKAHATHQHVIEYGDGITKEKSKALCEVSNTDTASRKPVLLVLTGASRDYVGIVLRSYKGKKDKDGKTNLFAYLSIQNNYSDSDRLHQLHTDNKALVESNLKSAFVDVWKANRMTFDDVMSSHVLDKNCKSYGVVSVSEDEENYYLSLDDADKTFTVDGITYADKMQKVSTISNGQLTAIYTALDDLRKLAENETDTKTRNNALQYVNEYENIVADALTSYTAICAETTAHNDIVKAHRANN